MLNLCGVVGFNAGKITIIVFFLLQACEGYIAAEAVSEFLLVCHASCLKAKCKSDVQPEH